MVKQVVQLTMADVIVVPRLVVADTFFSRFMGLMFKSELPEGEGLFIKGCNQIHMFWMKIPLDVLFLDDEGTVLYALEGIRPWRVSRMVRKSKAAIELPVGTISKYGITEGSKLDVSSLSPPQR